MDTGIKFKLEGQDEASLDKIGMGDMVAFERAFNLPATVLEPDVVDKRDPRSGEVMLDPDGEPLKEIISDYRLEWMAFMVWRSARRQGLVPKEVPFDQDFVDTIEDFDASGVEEAVKEAASKDPSNPDQ